MAQKNTIIAIAMLTLCSSGCVLKSKYDRVSAESLRLQQENTNLKTELSETKKDKKALDRTASQLSSRNEELSSANELLASRSTQSSRECIEAQQELLKLKKEKTKAEEKEAFARKTYDDLVKTLKDEIAAGQIAVAGEGERLTVNVANQILFPSGSNRIQAQGKKVLRKLSKVLKKLKDKRIEVEGHTDNIPIRGGLKNRFPTNWELSSARATTVVRYLDNQGVDPEKMAAVGYGPYRPIAENNTSRGRGKNRRIEIVLRPAPTEKTSP